MVGETWLRCSSSITTCPCSVSQEHYFKDKYLFYRFSGDEDGASIRPGSAEQVECEEQLSDVIVMLGQVGPDAMLRMILRKPYVPLEQYQSMGKANACARCDSRPHERTIDDLEIIYDELLHVKALSHLSSLVKRELASVLIFEAHPFKNEIRKAYRPTSQSSLTSMELLVQCSAKAMRANLGTSFSKVPFNASSTAKAWWKHCTKATISAN